METQRVFRHDFIPLNKSFKFNSGEKAVILKINKSDVNISVRKKLYTLPYRDFIILTKQIN